MLSKQEHKIMSAVYSLCDGTESCMVTATEVLSLLPAKQRITVQRLDDVLHSLHYDGYFDLITGERKSDKMYLIRLKERGFAYKRDYNGRKREIAFRILLAGVGALFTFLFGLLLKTIFGG